MPVQVRPTAPEMNEAPSPIEDLKARVSAMRELGVTRWGDIELGPAPGSSLSEKDMAQRIADAKAAEGQREKRMTFGASGGPRPRADR